MTRTVRIRNLTFTRTSTNGYASIWDVRRDDCGDRVIAIVKRNSGGFDRMMWQAYEVKSDGTAGWFIASRARREDLASEL